MAGKAHTKRKLYREMCRRQVIDGRINMADGSWGRGLDNSMKRDMIGGYRVGQRKR